MLKVFHELHLTHSALFQAVDRSLRRAEGISTAHQVILFALTAKDGLTISEVSQRTGHSKSRLTGLVNTLEKKQLLKRVSSATDGRATTLRLTEDGKGLIARTRGLTRNLNAEILAPFSKEECQTIATFLGHIQEVSLRIDHEFSE